MSCLFRIFCIKKTNPSITNNAAIIDPDNGSSNLETAEVGSPSGGNNSVEEVFRNPLIWEKIGSYLNMVDLLNCRLVNSGFHAMVMRETNFLDRCLVSLKPNQITRNIFGSTSEPWRNVELVFGNPGGEESTSDFRFDEDEMEWLYPIVSNVESLSLRMKLGTKGGDFYPILKRLLNAPKKLRSLAIEPRFLTERAKDIEDWKDTFEDLTEFEVLEPPSGWQKDIEDLKTCLFDCLRNCVLSAFANKMKDVQVLKYFYLKREDEAREVMFKTLQVGLLQEIFLPQIASVSTNTLKRVTFSELGTVNHKEERPDEDRYLPMGFLSFPLLESATFHLSERHPTEMIRKYFLTLPMLKELDFMASITTLPSSILNAIWERSEQLRTLKIRSTKFEGTNWQFFKNTKIEEFQLQLLKSGETVTLPDEALDCLPATIKRLRLGGPLASNPIPALARLNPTLVTELAFIDSGDCFTDDTIQYIRENFKMLRVLIVENAKRVTDAGFVASSQSGTLSGIKGLKFLSLRGCGSITDATVREIRFLELSHLDLSDNEGVTKEGWKQMLQNNPSLLDELKRSGKDHM